MPSKPPRKRIRREGWYDASSPLGRRGLPEQHLDRFYQQLLKVREAFFEPDEDGDMPVAIDITDRTAFERNQFEPLARPKDLLNPTNEELAEQLRVVASNSSALYEQLRRVSYSVRDRVQKSTAWGCGCRVEARPDHDNVMQVQLTRCAKHTRKFNLSAR